VRQFHRAHSRKRNVTLAMHAPNPAKHGPNCLIPPFAIDKYASVEDHAQVISPTPTYREAYGS